MCNYRSFLKLFLLVCFTAIIFASCEDTAPIIPDPNNPNTGENPDSTLTDPDEILASFFSIDFDELPNYANPAYPVHYDSPQVLNNDNTPGNNPVTNIGASLGRVLFYDTKLSIKNTTSCSSCHTQQSGFTDAAQFSQGFEGGLTGAHSMRLGNTNFYTGANMFWDKRANDLEDQSTQPIQDPIEMGFDASVGGIDSLIRKMEGISYYPILFERVFGSPAITEQRMQLALSQFIRSMVSVNSKFDEGYAAVYMPGQGNDGLADDFPNFTEQENMGKRLFFGPGGPGGGGGPMGGASCATCHQAPTFALSNNSRSNGLDAGETVIFKSPSLKNVAIVGNYMHDGRFATLEEVIDHYSTGMQNGPALDQRLRLPNNQGVVRPNFSQAEKAALVAFLRTLTDEVLIEDEKFSDPFK